MNDFWVSSGHALTDRHSNGQLLVTDEFLKAYLARPELMPPADACAAEHRLHGALLADPRRPIGPDEIAALADADARENWETMRSFRDHLLRHATLEAAYVDLVRNGTGATPPLFLNQLVHAILRNALDGCEDPFVVRAAELFFRPQRAALHQGALIVADEEAIAGVETELDVLTEDNAADYWRRSDRFDVALDLTVGRRGAAALATVIATWVRHLLSREVSVEPTGELRDAKWTWYVGLDAEGTRIGDVLWRGGAVDDETRRRVVGLFRLWLVPRSDPIYLILAMTPAKVLRLKPQNLVTGLPAAVPSGGAPAFAAATAGGTRPPKRRRRVDG